MNSQTAQRFWQLYRTLPKRIRQAARIAYQQFVADPSHPSLKFHRLAVSAQLWSVRVTRDFRAVGLRHGSTITWFWIGDHKEFDRVFKP